MSVLIKDLVALIQKRKPTYDELAYAVKMARTECGLKPPKRKTIEKQLIKYDDLRKFFKEVEKENIKIRLIMRFFLFMGLRISEVANLKVKYIDLTPGQELIYTERKNSENMSFCLPARMVDLLRAYLESGAEDQKFVFEYGLNKPYTERGIAQMMSRLKEKAGVGFLHPHAFRHRLVSFLDGLGWNDREKSLISGHKIPGNMSIYAHRQIENIRKKYNTAIDELYNIVFGG